MKVPLEWKLITAPPVPVPVPVHHTRKHTTSFVLNQFGRRGKAAKKKHLGCCVHGDEHDCGKVQGLSAPTKQLISSELLKTKALDNSLS